MAVRMELSRILIREMTDMQIIELTEIGGERTFPIVIGLPEAFAIERRLKGVHIERPQTHDLLASTIELLGGELRKVIINDLRDGTFFAVLIVEQNGNTIEIDSRPSDAIAIAVAGDVPIEVAEHVLDETESDAQSIEEFSKTTSLEDDDLENDDDIAADTDSDDDDDDDDDEDRTDELNWD